MSQPKFYNKDKSLTAYALACGYIQVRYFNNIRVELLHDTGCYHVKVFDRTLTPSRQVWHSCKSLSYARWHFANAIRDYRHQVRYS